MSAVVAMVAAPEAGPAVARRAAELAAKFGLRLAAGGATGNALELHADAAGVSLMERGDAPRRGLTVNFTALARRAAGFRGDPLVRAIGADAKVIIDATAGLGQDAFRLACLGFDVTAIERHPAIALLLSDGAERAKADVRITELIEDRLRVVHADSLRWLLDRRDPRPDVICIDPMFPPKRRDSALSSKAIRLVRALVGDDHDAHELLEAARRVARLRVVVKRADDSPPLAPGSTTTYAGKLVRFDVYKPTWSTSP